MVAAASVTGKEQTVTFPSWGVYSLETYKTLFLSWRTKVGEEHLLTQELDLLRWEMANLFRSWRPAFGEYQCRKYSLFRLIEIIQATTSEYWTPTACYKQWQQQPTFCLKKLFSAWTHLSHTVMDEGGSVARCSSAVVPIVSQEQVSVATRFFGWKPG